MISFVSGRMFCMLEFWVLVKNLRSSRVEFFKAEELQSLIREKHNQEISIIPENSDTGVSTPLTAVNVNMLMMCYLVYLSHVSITVVLQLAGMGLKLLNW